MGFDQGTRAIYAHDASNYRQVPLGVVVPANIQDVIDAVAVCRQHGAAILMRGTGTSLAGQTVNTAVVIDISRNLREIVSIDPEAQSARVQPGVVRDQLNERTVADHGLTFAPDTSTHQWASLGGMIGNNSCGVHSVMAGRTSDNVEELDILLYDGTRMTVGNHSEEEADRIIAAGGRKGEIYGRLRELRDRYADAIRSRYPDIPRRVSGYNLDELLPEKGFNVARALVGTEGTAAIVLEARLNLVPAPAASSLLVLGYSSAYVAGDHVPEIMDHGPVGLEGIDDTLIEAMKRQDMHPDDIPLLPEGGGWLLVEFGGANTEESEGRARGLMDALADREDSPSMSLFTDPVEARRLWAIRESGLGATAHAPPAGEHWPGWEDAAVPPEKLGGYLRDFRDLMDRYGYEASLYGHFGQGCIHCRLSFDLKTGPGVQKWRRFLGEAADLVVSYGGSLSGEHGDGQQRGELLERMYGDELIEAFCEFKSIWDPDWKLNPGKIVAPNRITDNLRFGPDYEQPDVPTYFAYPEDDGSFGRATIERCVGVGRCRTTSSGTMCPSYQATLDERHSTRGRARILGEMLRGDTITDGFASREVFDALDLCLACKGCRGDCPVNVDMATYKAEFLSRYYKTHRRPMSAWTMGLVMYHARLGSRVPRLANALAGAPLVGPLLRRAGGLTDERPMPPFATRTFRDWYARRELVNPDAPRVVLLPDTFNNFFHPEVARSATQVLEDAGYRVVVPREFFCCGRPLYDFGMLDRARSFLLRMMKALGPYVSEGVPVVGLEPSCVATLRDELPNMFPDDQAAEPLTRSTYTLSEFLVNVADYDPPRLERRVLVHTHCNHGAVMGTRAEQALYERMGMDFDLLDSGCCGVAGAFGFEPEHYDLSMRIGEQRLLPTVRRARADTLLLTDGFSCKLQIQQSTSRRALHTAQMIRMAHDHGRAGPVYAPPERDYPDVVNSRRGRTATGARSQP